MTEPIDIAAIREEYSLDGGQFKRDLDALCDEVDRLRAMFRDVMGDLCHKDGCPCCGALWGDDD